MNRVLHCCVAPCGVLRASCCVLRAGRWTGVCVLHAVCCALGAGLVRVGPWLSICPTLYGGGSDEPGALRQRQTERKRQTERLPGMKASRRTCPSTLASKHLGAQATRQPSTQAPKRPGTQARQAPRRPSIQAPRHPSAQAPRHPSTQAPKHPSS